jgi:hypothetical protein
MGLQSSRVVASERLDTVLSHPPRYGVVVAFGAGVVALPSLFVVPAAAGPGRNSNANSTCRAGLAMSGCLAVIASAQLIGIRGMSVVVEVHASDGVPSFTIVGQPDGACREARDRVRAALLSSGYASGVHTQDRRGAGPRHCRGRACGRRPTAP